MTGFGSAEVITPAGRFRVEARAVNHRYAEVVVRLPRELATLEDRVRALVQKRVLRGRVEVTIVRDERAGRTRTVRSDVDLARAYAQALRELADALGVPDAVGLPLIASFPDVLKVEEAREDLEALWPAIAPAVEEALAALVAMREAEGRRLAQDLQARLGRMEDVLAQVERRVPEIRVEYARRLRQRIAQLLGEVPVDEQRLAMEVAVFAERADVSEELTRLRSHLAQFRHDVAAAPGPVGRRLEFLLQEMHREANTIGAKANDLEIARAVIALKGELESLREQVQNIE
ncbi:MAG: YicC/YloC family endoribonuclease [Armatimonadota bacterium]|nr:YicC/YloC family endoribonuclease [Armatimonadota bacterium]MDR7402622.1 YicC/YloC family endoribonuclease [Armatimonadota bacterium]MDR7404836.1 YicC/YloC family endoribonuclease [Armatimonadota bacterium]MDR7436776.1 YicC/YloC family endoribonuclease [Armatimonadota bacterium]MDR7472723.1 YicC/YloC family endoribonuclease [Armatimonadota bacterium]